MRESSWRPRAGDRVRVRDGVGRTSNCAELHHYPEEAGRNGLVVLESAIARGSQHPFLVEFDRPVPRVWVVNAYLELVVRHYAPDELEPA